jgi:hypothetical protein
MIETADGGCGGILAKSENPFFRFRALEELVEDEPRESRPSELEIIHYVRNSLSYSDLCN